ncbi:MAG: hypothetical protein DRI89_01375 [Bacteroidetes bacterium]|nr:MAG: hypothetical protein DRI89_01375 [Bacteroidota bacterium]
MKGIENKIRHLLTLAMFLLSFSTLFGQATVTVWGNWRQNVEATEITNAGDDFPNVYESAADQSRLRVRRQPTSQLFPWRIDVRGDIVTWDNRLEIWIRRTNDGISITPGATITGGMVYQQISIFDQYFFEGNGSIRRIALQYQYRGVSVVIPAKTYRQTIVYTLTEL